jgi:hypothetical protein
MVCIPPRTETIPVEDLSDQELLQQTERLSRRPGPVGSETCEHFVALTTEVMTRFGEEKAESYL